MTLSKEVLEQMPAGVEIDKLIATRLHKWEYIEVGYWQPRKNGVAQLPDSSTAERQAELYDWLHSPEIIEATDHSIGEYWIDVAQNFIMRVEDFSPSTNIRLAWQVLRQLNKLGFEVELKELLPYRGREDNLSRCRVSKFEEEEDDIIFSVSADETELAICRAALLATL